jgi:hypothetical protein
MTAIEQEIWNYIDGNCTLLQKEKIEEELKNNIEYKKCYLTCKAINEQLIGLELEAPSMSFTRNVMDSVKADPQSFALKTKVNAKIVFAIASLFVFAFVFLFSYAISRIDFTAHNFSSNFDFSMLVKSLTNPMSIKIFLFVDVALMLVFLDSYFRKQYLKKE